MNLEELLKKIALLLGLGEDAGAEEVTGALEAVLAENKSLKEEDTGEEQDVVVANKAVCELLGLSAGAPTSDVTARIMELKAGKVDGVDLAAELLALKQQAAQRDAADAVKAAMQVGKVAPAQKDWATDYALKDPGGFAAFLEKAPQAVPLGEILPEGAVALKDNKPDEATTAISGMLGIDAEDLQKYGGM